MAKQKQDRWANAQSMGLDALEQSGFRFNPPKAQEQAAPDGAEPASRPLMSLSRGSLLNDLVTEGVNSAVSGVSSVGKFISPGNSVSKALDTFVEDSQGNFTDVAKQGKQAYEQEMQAAEGVGDEVAATLRYVANNPGMAAAQAVGSFAGPGAAIKGAGLGARAMRLGATGATRAGLGAGAVVGGAMAGGDAAGTAYDLVLKAGGTPEQAEAAARDASIIPGAIGAAGGLVGAERLFAGGKGFAGNTASRALKTGAVEGLQEGVEEGVTQYEGQRAAVPYDPSIDSMRGVGGAATMGAVMGGATGGGISLITGEPAKAGDPIRDLKTGGTGTLARAADTGLEHQARQADAGISEGQFNAAMTAMEGQAADDQKGIKAAGRADKTGFAGQAPRASMAQTMGAMGDVGSTEEVSALADRIMGVKESLADPTTRDFIRQNLGDEAFNEAAYYAEQADKPGAIPDKTRENMLALAEAIVSRARLTPIQQPGALGTNVGPAPEALGAPQGVPAIGLDTTPTGAFRVDAAGNAAPEVNADVISTRQAQAERGVLGAQARRASAVPADPAPKAPAPPAAIGYDTTPTGVVRVDSTGGARPEIRADQINTKQAKPARDETLGQQARKASAVWADPAPKPAAAPKALPYDTSPTGRMVAGADGVATETNAQRINRQQARSVQPGDRTAPSGNPFKNLQAAKTEQRRNGGAVVEVNGGWVVRAQADDANQVTFEMSVGEAKAPTPAGTQVAIPQKLNVTFGGKTYPVESIADAQRKWIDFQNKAGAGVSEVGNGVRIADQDGKFVARISFNGRVWDGEGDGANLIAEAPASSSAPAPKPPKAKSHPPTVRGSRALAAISRSLGGLSPDLLPDLSEKVQRTRVNKAGKKTQYTVWDNPAIPGIGPLFRMGGTSDLSEVARVLEESGYLTAGSVENDPIGATQRTEAIIKAEMREGGSTVQIGDADAIDAEMRARQEAAMGDESTPWDDFSFPPEDLDAVGFIDADETSRAITEQLIAEAEALGIDTEAIRDDTARIVGESASQEEYHAATQEAIRQAIAQAGRDAEERNTSTAREGNPDGRSPAEQAGGEGSQGQRDGGSDQEGLSLTAPTRADIEAQQDRADQAEALDEKAQAKRESEVGDSTFMTGFTGDGRQDNTADLFAQGAQEQDQQATTGGIAGGTAGGSRSAPGVKQAKPSTRIEDIGEKIGGARKDLATSGGKSASRAKPDDDRPAWARRFEISQIMTPGGQINEVPENGRWVIRDNRSLDWMKQPRQVGRATYATKEDAEAAVPLAAVSLKHRAVPTREGNYEIWRDISDTKRVKVVDQVFDTRDEAMVYMVVNAVKIIETNTTFGEGDIPKPPDRRRTGPERRTGNVKGEDFKGTFGFRGVEFGNWNNNDERQELMNDAWDGLMDLADVLGVPPKALGMNGDLALAFGARGQGLSSARAHYERSRAVINLTKESGAGSLAHEWFHAMDHYFGRQDGKASSMWETQPDGTRTLKARDAGQDYASSGLRGERSGVRAELRTAYTDLINTIFKKAETYVEDVAKADKFTGSTKDELARQLDLLRGELSQQKDPKYYKRNNKPAAPEQLAEFDAIAAKLVAGELLETDWRTISKDGGKSASTRWTNDALERLNAIHKAVRGRSGFNAERKGTLDSLRSYMTRYSQRLKMLADAQSSTEKQRMVPTAFAMDAKELDQGRGTDYWTTPHEMAARAFQGYVEDKIAEAGGSSRFLNYAPENAAIITPWGYKRPFPHGAERKAINAKLDAFVSELKTREDDAGNVGMFSRSPEDESFYRSQVDYEWAPPSVVNRVKQQVESLRTFWKNSPEVVVLASFADAPEAMQRLNDQQMENGAVGEPEGFFYKGKAYLLAPHMKSPEDVRRVLFHETLGHLGLRGVFGDGLNQILDQLWATRRKDVQAKADAYGLDTSKQAARRMAAEEVLAEMAQDRPEIGFVRRAVAIVKQWLRKNLPGFAKMKMSDDEIVANFLMPAQRFIERGQGAQGQQLVPAFSRVDEPGSGFGRNMPATIKVDGKDRPTMNSNGQPIHPTEEGVRNFWKWFGDSKVVDKQGRPMVVYHGTRREFNSFRASHQANGLIFFSEHPSVADGYAIEGGGWHSTSEDKVNVEIFLEEHPNPTDDNVANYIGELPGGVETAKQIKDFLAEWSSGANVMPVYLSAKSIDGDQVFPKPWREAERAGSASLIAKGHDAVWVVERGGAAIAVTSPTQIKSAIGNSGDFNPEDPNIGFSRSAAATDLNTKARNAFSDFVGSAGVQMDWLDKTLKTQYAKAERFPEFGAVFDKLQDYIEGVSSFANQAADKAPDILPKLDSFKDLMRDGPASLLRHGLSQEDIKALSAPVFEGTLNWTRDTNGELVQTEDPASAGVVFSDAELRDKFGLSQKQIGHYRQFRATVDESLDQVVAADIIKLLGKKAPASIKALANTADGRARLRESLRQTFGNSDDEAMQTIWKDQIAPKYDHVASMKAKGYAPLSRFGKFFVHVVDKATGETVYFGMEETRIMSNRTARDMREEYGQGFDVAQGTMSQESYKLMSDVPVDAMEMFASAIGAEKSEVFQKYIALAKNNRSTLKRLLKRKGRAGYSLDAPRVLASFVTSNARASAAAVNMMDAKDLAQEIQAGDVKDEAIKLIEAVGEPQESGAAVRGMLFTNFIGGSIASAMVNMTQPVMMTLPYLSQFGGIGKASKRLVSAAGMVMSGKVADPELEKALKRAESEGIVAPQEIHHLLNQATSSAHINPKVDAAIQKLAFVWSTPFALAESFNRKASFIAAYQTAQAEGIANPYAFAQKAVTETQGLYNAGNKPNIARGTVGAFAMTFKQYSIHYLEWLARMAKSGPEGKKAALWALALLVMAAGGDGLPFSEDLNDIIDTVGQSFGYDTNAKRWRHQMAADAFGEEAAEVLSRGLSASAGFPVDVSMRMGMGNLLPATDILKKSNTDTARSLAEIAGPGGALFTQYSDALKLMLSGEAGAAAMKLTPNALQNLGKAAKMLETGEYRDSKDRKVMDVDGADAAMKALSFQPAQIARESAKMSESRQSEVLAKTVEGEITDAWARALVDGDAQAQEEARQRLLDWNEKNPDMPIRINRAQIATKAKKMRQTRAERYIKTVAPERRAAASQEIGS